MQTVAVSRFHIPDEERPLLERVQLMEQLNQGLARRLTLIVAPAGYGKSMAAAAWLRSLESANRSLNADDPRRVEVAWYSLDRSDSDYVRFFSHFAASLRQSAPEGWPLQISVQAVAEFSEDQLINLIAQVCREFPSKVVIVLDDYHVIEDQAIHRTLHRLIQLAGDKLHLVITARRDPPLKTSSLRARGQLSEIRTGDLRFSRTETEHLLRKVVDLELSDQAADMLQRQTEGWITGLQLATVAIRSQADVDAFLDRLHGSRSSYVSDYLVDEVLANIPSDLEGFLLRTAHLDRFNAGLAALVTSLDEVECRRAIDRLYRANYFLIALDDRREWYRYHHQFQAMLVERSRLRASSQELRSMLLQAAAWLVDHDMMEDGLAYYADQGCWDAVVAAINRSLYQLQNRGEWATLQRWIAVLPRRLREEQVCILLARAFVLRSLDQIVELDQIVDLAEQRLDAGAEGEIAAPNRSLRGEIAALHTSFSPRPMSMQIRAAKARLALELLPLSAIWLRAYVHGNLARALTVSGDLEAGVTSLQTVLETESTDTRTTVWLFHSLIALYWFSGMVEQVGRLSRRYVTMVEENDQPLQFTWAHYGVGFGDYYCGRLERAFEHLLLAADPNRPAYFGARIATLDLLVPAGVALGKVEIVRAIIAELRRLVPVYERRVQVPVYDAFNAYLSHLTGDAGAALDWLQTDPSSSVAPGMSTLFFDGVCVRLLCADGGEDKLQRAEELIAIHLDVATGHPQILRLIEWMVLSARLNWRRGYRIRSLSQLDDAVDLAFSRGFRYLGPGEDLAEMLAELTRHGRMAEEASVLLATMLSYAPRIDRVGPAPDRPEPLSQRELDVLDLLAAGRTNREIAQELGISHHTVRNHTSNIYQKLHVSSRKQAVQAARKLGLMP